jgi:DNA replication factor GINS
VDLDELQTVRDTERSKDSLQGLEESFYVDVADHIAELKERRKQAAEEADDPFGDPEVQQLTGEIDATEQVVESIYERRVGKLVKLASFAAADMPADEDGLTREERNLFTDLVSRIKENRAHVLDVLAGEQVSEPADPTDVEPATDEPSAEPAEPSASAEPAGAARSTSTTDEPEPAAEADAGSEPTAESGSDEPRVSAADLMGEGPSEPDPNEAEHRAHEPDPGPDSEPGTEPAAESTPATSDEGGPSTEASEETVQDGVERVTLRITRDVGEIVGVDDREYDLANEDVVTLPEANAGALLQRDAAERLD